MTCRASIVLAVLLCATPVAAQRKPLTDRWTAELAPTMIVVRGVDDLGSWLHDGSDDGMRSALLEVTETSSVGALGSHTFLRWGELEGSDAVPPCRAESPPAPGSLVMWLECDDPHELRYALVEHSDGKLLLVELRRVDAVTRSLVESMRPREPEHICELDCDLGPDRWLTLHSEGGRRLARSPSELRRSTINVVSEVRPFGPPELVIHYFYQSHAWARQPDGPFVRKVLLLGEPFPAFATGPHTLSLYTGGTYALRLELALVGRTEEDLERAVRMIESATRGPEWTSEYDLVPRFELPQKTERSRRSIGARGIAALITLSVIGLSVGVAAWLARRRRAARVTRP